MFTLNGVIIVAAILLVIAAIVFVGVVGKALRDESKAMKELEEEGFFD